MIDIYRIAALAVTSKMARAIQSPLVPCYLLPFIAVYYTVSSFPPPPPPPPPPLFLLLFLVWGFLEWRLDIFHIWFESDSMRFEICD